MSIVSVILFISFILMCFMFCWGHINGYRDACRRYRIPINRHEDY